MAVPSQQSFANHSRLDPPFHLLILPVFLVTVINNVVQLYRHPGWLSAWGVIFAITLLILAFKVRLYSLKVQDRVIRLEERIRLMTLLSEPLRSRVSSLTEGQLIALRFASDREVPALVQKTLDGNLTPKAIKQSIQDWRADHFRV